ncbi:MAG: FAD-dependent oxidoreductase [Cyanophyceae cyanobacterium]
MNKPIIIVVDDDSEVLRTIVRDLRHKYGLLYRVLSSESAEKALEMLPQLKLRNQLVGLFLVDQRMPQITGVEFLEQAREFFPNAKRVLLTAYADTSVAIYAINKTKIDYYLMKPWDPPEVNLYPILNDLLEVWRLSYLSRHERIQVIGSRWLPTTHQIKDFLASYHVPYVWRDLEKDRDARQLMEQANQDFTQLPLILFPDGSQLAAPSTWELAEKIGLKTRAQMPFYDLIIIGGGPAGLAAAVSGASEGLKTALIEKQAPGGQAGTSSRIENYLGFPAGLSGGDLARRAMAQAYKFGTEIIAPQEVTQLSVNSHYKHVTLADGTELGCHTLIVATGVSYTRLNVPGIRELTGAGIYYGAATTEAIACRDEEVYIVGGANSAGQAALCLSHYARSVTILLRGETLAAKMSRYLIDRIQAAPNIWVKPFTKVIEARGSERLESLTLADTQTEATTTIKANALFVFIGAKPNTNWLQGIIECDRDGYIVTGNELIESGRPKSFWSLKRDPFLFETCVPGIFAIGDVRCNSIKRVASAVGEGSVAVQLVHQYLSSVY